MAATVTVLSVSYERLSLLEATQIHLFLSIIVFMLMIGLFTPVSDAFVTAVFACISTPATYTLTYYHSRALRQALAYRFIVRSDGTPIVELGRLWVYEVIALTLSYVMGLLVYASLTNSLDYATYTWAFGIVQGLRAIVLLLAWRLEEMGVEVNHPLVTLMVAITAATIMTTIVLLLS